LGLRDRVAALGGELHVESASRAGTEVRAWFPV
jgi:signal transduction histidine kinase